MILNVKEERYLDVNFFDLELKTHLWVVCLEVRFHADLLAVDDLRDSHQLKLLTVADVLGGSSCLVPLDVDLEFGAVDAYLGDFREFKVVKLRY